VKTVTVNTIPIGNNTPLVLIAGPCVIEGESAVLTCAEKLVAIAEQCSIPLIFKASYEKDNRSTPEGYRGPGVSEGLAILQKVKDRFSIPVLSDVHRETDIDQAQEVLDIIQIPAFLCQQTSLLIKAGRSQRVINIKKGPFLAPENMTGPISKIESTGNQQILLTERGASFGYNRLIADICSIPTMQHCGYPVIFDATHIIRNYGHPSSEATGGRPECIPALAQAGVAAGSDGLFIETHPKPQEALCDAASMLSLEELPTLLEKVIPLSQIVRK
jgi:2-dehydro-3-deoxyphosphooctonate aldolase (KDO 8-P synthase)